MTFRSGEFPSVIAHRGGSLLRPENTMVAFAHAHSLGIRTIETDLHLTSDGVLVCHHDDTLNRTTSGKGPIGNRLASDFASIDAGYWFSKDGQSFPYRGQGLRVPTLAETLETFPDTSFILELKPEGLHMADAVYRFLERHEARDRVCVASFHEPTIAAFRARARGRIRTSAGQTRLAAFWALAKLPLAKLPHGVRPRVPFQMMQVPVSHRGMVIVAPPLIAAAHAQGVEVHVWTINEPSEMRRLYDLGVDAIITDAPDRAIEVLRGRSAERGVASPPT
jgi:glycerophosphoryl diester phosphodiesterase